MDAPTKIMTVKFGRLLHFICTLLHEVAAPLFPPTPMPLTVLAYAHMFNKTVCLFNRHTHLHTLLNERFIQSYSMDFKKPHCFLIHQNV